MKNEFDIKNYDLANANWAEIARLLTYRWFPKYNVEKVNYKLSKTEDGKYKLDLVINFKKLATPFPLTYVVDPVDVAMLKGEELVSDDITSKLWHKYLAKTLGKDYKKALKKALKEEEVSEKGALLN